MDAASKRAQEPMLFFPHDANAGMDEKCLKLILRRGYDGYGRWWRVCEYMAGKSGHRIEYQTDEDVLILAQVLGFSGGSFADLMAIEDCKAFIQDLIDIGLLEADGNGFLKNSRMENNALYWGRQRANGAKGGRPRKNQQTSKTTGKEV